MWEGRGLGITSGSALCPPDVRPSAPERRYDYHMMLHTTCQIHPPHSGETWKCQVVGGGNLPIFRLLRM